jgi:hypothetical protein
MERLQGDNIRLSLESSRRVYRQRYTRLELDVNLFPVPPGLLAVMNHVCRFFHALVSFRK